MSFQKIVFLIAFLGIFAGGFLVNAQPAQAATVEELQALIAQLKVQILQLQAQLVATQGQPAAWCHDFNTNIRLGDSGDEVYALQNVLLKEGLFGESDETSDKTFGEQTASAVVGFQQKYKSEILTPFGLKFGTGFVGKGTRAKLNALYGCGVTQPTATVPVPTPTPTPTPPPTLTPASTPSITVISPNGGERWEAGKQYNITWISNGLHEVGVVIGIHDYAINVGYHVQLAGTNGTFGWTIPANFKPSSQYKVKMTGCTDASCSRLVEDESDNYFSIVSAVATTTLSIADVSGIKSSYTPGEKIVLSIKGMESDGTPAMSSEGYNIQVYIYDSGRNKTYAGLNAAYNQFTGLWDALLSAPTDTSLSYDLEVVLYCSSPGYPCMTKKTAQVSKVFKFNVVSATTTPSITVLSPNGGEVFQQGENNTISWKGGKNKVQIGLVKSNFDPAKDGVLGWIFTSALPEKTGTWDANSVSDLSLMTVWNVLALHPGPFKIIAVSENAYGNYCFGSAECTYDYSDNYFSIVSTRQSITTQPSITSFNYTETDAYNGSVQFYWINSGTDFVNLWIPCYSGLTMKNAATGANFFCGESDLKLPSNSPIYLKFTNSSGSMINASAIVAPITSSATSVTIYSNYSKTINFSIVSALTSLKNIEDQTASIADAVSRLLQSFEEFKKSNP